MTSYCVLEVVECPFWPVSISVAHADPAPPRAAPSPVYKEATVSYLPGAGGIFVHGLPSSTSTMLQCCQMFALCFIIPSLSVSV
jgi:hypothetical protein